MASTKTAKCTSWDDFILQIAQLRGRGASPVTHLFRGHANTCWPLRSSLGRIAHGAKMDDLRVVDIEKLLLDHFIRHVHLLLPSSMLADESDLVHWWTVMQHYRAPTRLLDWTRSPFVALYFAWVEGPSDDGAVWAVRENKLDKLGPEDQALFDKDPKSFFWEIRVRVHFTIVDSNRPSERMNAQQGVFTVANAIVPNHEQLISNLTTSKHENDLVKLEIQANCKIEMLERLREMNVHGLSLFPGIDGVGAMMRDLARISVQKQSVSRVAMSRPSTVPEKVPEEGDIT